MYEVVSDVGGTSLPSETRRYIEYIVSASGEEVKYMLCICLYVQVQERLQGV